MHLPRVGNTVAIGRVLFAIVLLLVLATSAFAQTSPRLTVVSESDFPGSGIHQFVVHSALVERDFVVVVNAPPIFGSWVSEDLKAAGAKQADRKLPAIYALDSGYGIAGPTAQMMVGVGMMSPAYVVSVGYREGESWRRTDLLHRTAAEGGVAYGGGGAKFQSFLIEELRPFLEARYPLDPAKAILFGHSFGGLFAANVLADAPEAFEGYVIASPSLWIDQQVIGKLSSAVGKIDRRVFLAVGDREEPRMRDGVNQLWAVLPAHIKAEKKVFGGEDHISYYPLLVQAAFRWMLPPPGAERATITLSPEDLQRIAGVYALADGRVVTVTLKGEKAFVQVTGTPGESELLPETPQRFFLPGGYNVVMTFDGAMDTPASALVVDVNGAEMRGYRKAQ